MIGIVIVLIVLIVIIAVLIIRAINYSYLFSAYGKCSNSFSGKIT